jgi:hypothetical protein
VAPVNATTRPPIAAIMPAIAFPTASIISGVSVIKNETSDLLITSLKEEFWEKVA